MTEKKDENIV